MALNFLPGFAGLPVGKPVSKPVVPPANGAWNTYGRLSEFLKPKPTPVPVTGVPKAQGDLPTRNIYPISNFSFALHPHYFVDPDGDALTYTATKADGSALPDWMVFDPETLTFSGTAPLAGYDNFTVKVTATDPDGNAVSKSFVVGDEFGKTPQLLDVPDKSIRVGDPLRIDLAHYFAVPSRSGLLWNTPASGAEYKVTLADGSPLPGWLHVGREGYPRYLQLFSGEAVAVGYPSPSFSVMLEGEPTAANIGALDLMLSVSYQGKTYRELFTLEVEKANRAPVAHAANTEFTYSWDPQTMVGRPFLARLPENLFTDPDGDSLYYGIRPMTGDGAPTEWLNFDPETMTLYGIPPDSLKGPVYFELIAYDGQGGSTGIPMHLSDATVYPEDNVAPQLVCPLPEYTLLTGDDYYSVDFPSRWVIDPNNDPLTITGYLVDANGNKVDWLGMNVFGNGLFAEKIPATPGEYTFHLTVSDPYGASLQTETKIHLAAEPPVVTGTDGDDVLLGDAASQTLDGGKGDDVLAAGAGSDVYIFGRGYGHDRIVNNYAPGSDGEWKRLGLDPGLGTTPLDWLFDIEDVVQINDIDYRKLWFTQEGEDLVVSVIDSDDQLVIEGWYHQYEVPTTTDGVTPDASGQFYVSPDELRGAYNRVDAIQIGTDYTLRLSAEGVDLLVQAMSAYDGAPGGALPDMLRNYIDSVWHHNGMVAEIL